MKIKSLGFALALLAAMAARAEIATVEAVQYPAWLDRGGASVPLAPGMRLQPKDQIRTGENARVRLKMGEGSAVKLGEKAQFLIASAQDVSIFRTSLQIIAGAFRFTSDALIKRRRDVSIQAKTVTVGIRGTDVWGKATGDRDLVCLLEGKVTVGAEGHPQVTLDKPLDYYQKPRDAAPSVEKVDANTLAIWAAETELSADGAGAGVQGKWRVVAAVKNQRDAALALNRRLRAAGYPAEITSKDSSFAVQVGHLAGEKEANALASAIRAIEGVENPMAREGN